jgi:cysteine synthase A
LGAGVEHVGRNNLGVMPALVAGIPLGLALPCDPKREGRDKPGHDEGESREEFFMAKFNNILETVGRTPVVKINRLAPKGINLYVKSEAFNPLGSVKDRLALGVIEAAEKSGDLKPGQTVVEATSGNTGIGLAMVCAAKGYPLVVTMAETFSVERRKLMRFLGAKVVLTPAAERGMGMVLKAQELAKTHGWFLTRQFENEANPDMHERTTGPEIVADFKGEKLDYWVTGFGTGGTLTGVSRVLRKERPDTKIVVCEPADAPMLSTKTPQERNPDGSPAKANPAFKPHPMQGWSPDFIPKITAEAVDAGVIDRIITIAGADAMKCSRDLAQKEGIFVGITAGGTFAGALEVAKTAAPGSTILAMLPDTGERYLSTPLFGDIAADMNDEELKISNSTPNHRMPPKAA